MKCGGCGTENRAGRRFCTRCGSPLELSCAACGAVAEAGDRFCGVCGAALVESGATATAEPVSERRLVSVLFADIVGFTSLSEHRDPEEVRDLLSDYFDRCRTLIERHGGTVEKFIGDAVMAVWGTPVAREDDPERAVRTGLALIQAVSELSDELRVRVGVLTGNAAVEVGSESEGMVLGDTVNTASRLQTLAAPGTVLVDDVTRRASEAAIAYEDAGRHEVKGREQPVHAWRALRVVAGVGGARRSAGLEAPFVGRDVELQTIVAASEQVTNTGRARLVAIVGEAGSGKSRLLWEYYKYIDGVQKVVRWHQGRCLSYGEGVGYWALAEMVRARAGIVEEEDPDLARAKLRAIVEEFLQDEREQRLVEPRLAHLLGLEQRSVADRADLFSGWRLFFERVSDNAPVVLAFEDLQWADSGLLEFIDYLLEWSADRPLFILALGRSELRGKRPWWEAITLGPVSDEAMREALGGLVPGLPDELMGRILRRAEGVPLYAVETVRMLLDRGLLTQEGARYVLTRDVGELDVPETLHALAAARLDGLSGAERAVLQDAAVYGQSFTAAAVAALGSRTADEVGRILDGLVAKQVLGLNNDALSAERGQYHFLQTLLRTTAYGTLSRRDRKERHLAVARHLQEAWGESAPELAEVLAAHLLDAAEAEPDSSDAAHIRAMACDTLAEAGRRALSLALGPEAQRAFDRAAELARDDAARAPILHQAGQAALQAADYAAGRERLVRAVALFESLGDREGAARSVAVLADILRQQDRLEEAIELNRRAVAGLAEGSPDKAAALAALSSNLAFSGALEEAFAAADAALAIAEPLQEWRTVCEAFNTTSFMRQKQGRVEEAAAIRERCLALALEHDLADHALRAYNNVADLALQLDRFEEASRVADLGLTLAQSRGDRRWEDTLMLMATTVRITRGEWDALPEVQDDLPPTTSALLNSAYLVLLARVQGARADLGALERVLTLTENLGERTNIEFAASPLVARAIALNGIGRHAEALELALPIATASLELIANEDRREAVFEVGVAALALGDEAALDRVVTFIAGVPPAMRGPLLRASAARFEGLLAWRHGDFRGAEERLVAATRELRGAGARFNLAQALLERAEILTEGGRDDEAEPLLAESSRTFEQLGAVRWIERCDVLRTRVQT